MSGWGSILAVFAAAAVGSALMSYLAFKVGYSSRSKELPVRAIDYPPAVADRVAIDMEWLIDELGPLLWKDEVVALNMAKLVCIRIGTS